jgi:hypothetical protein
MTKDRGLGGGNGARAPFPRRSRKRWTIAGGIAAVWLVLYLVSGSVLSGTMLLAAFAATGAIAVVFLRSMGVTRDHPRIRQLSSRPWRDGQAVLRQAVSHFRDVFVVTPSGSMFAPNSVEIQMNPDDLVSLCDRIELGVVSASVTEAYEEQVFRYGARFATPERAEVYVAGDERIPRGRYRLRHGQPDTAADADFDGWAERGPGAAITTVNARTVVDVGLPTVREKTFTPALRLVTGDAAAETRMTGARAGRGSVELVLPNLPTISREHARFAFSDGRWCVTNLGMNGLTVNGAPAATEHPLSDGDTIRWGSRPDALVSRVEIG